MGADGCVYRTNFYLAAGEKYGIGTDQSHTRFDILSETLAALTFLFAFSWFGITGRSGLVEGIGLVCGVFLGTYLWWGALSCVVALLKKKAKVHRLQGMNWVFGIVLILFGVVVILLSACGKSPKHSEPDTVITETTASDAPEMDSANTLETAPEMKLPAFLPAGFP